MTTNNNTRTAKRNGTFWDRFGVGGDTNDKVADVARVVTQLNNVGNIARVIRGKVSRNNSRRQKISLKTIAPSPLAVSDSTRVASKYVPSGVYHHTFRQHNHNEKHRTHQSL